MKRLVAIALVLAASAIPASAQRSGGRGASFSRGPSISSARGFQSAPSFSRYPGPSPARSGFHNAPYPARRFPVSRPFRSARPYFAPFGYPGVVGYTYLGYPDLNAPFDADAAAPEAPPIPYVDPGNYGYAPDPGPQPYAPVASYAQPPQPRPEPPPAETITLIFKDGRPPQQIQNYIATRSTITVIEGQRHHDIAVADLDVPATVQANRDSSTGFHLPAATR